MKQYILFNPVSGGGKAEEKIKANDSISKKGFETELIDVTKFGGKEAYTELFAKLQQGDRVILCGGDGTLHHFINDTDGIDIKQDVFYFPSGTGNDFMNDLKEKPEDGLLRLNPYIENLPQVTVNGVTKRFLNNVSFGIDGYCCEVGDDMRASGVENINYTKIAIKGLLGGYKTVNATITIDGMSKSYKKVWLAPTMNGRFCGGGMMLAPDQDRLNPERTVSLLVMYGSGKLKTLTVFPSVFKGEHIKHTEMVECFTGHNITVTFDKPTALQIDGETIRNVTSYTVKTVR